ncbi:MAG TPA: hypothetical protein VK640_15605 [Actinomycetes bacterium]|nr:hypothetical protein [Actinomycetes bacterium]
MSDSSFPFQGETMTQAPQPDVSPTGSGNRTKLLLLGAVAGLLVLAVAAYFLVFAGSEEADVAKPGKPVVAAPDTEDDTPASDTPGTKKQKKRISAKSFGRDPFEPLIVEAVAVDTSGSTGGSTSVTADTTTGTTTGTTSDASTTQTEATTPSESTSHRFKVVDVAPDNSRISVKVDGNFHRNLKAGEVFATYFKVRFIGGAVNDFQYGEETFKVVGDKAVSIG